MASEDCKPSKASLVLSSLNIAPLITLGPCRASLAPLLSRPMAASRSYILLQKGEDPFHTRFEDLHGLTAFTMWACYLPLHPPGELTLSLARRCSAVFQFLIYSPSLYALHQVDRMPNTLVQLRRETPWSQKHQGIMGPGAAFFYFGPAGAPGHIIYGNAPSQPMVTTLRRKRSSA